MRAIALPVLVLLLHMGMFVPVSYGLDSALLGTDLAKAVDLPDQKEEAGIADVLLELRAERLNATLIVLTHFPQGLGAAVDKKVAAFGELLHSKAYADTLDRSSYTYEQELGEIAKAMADGKPVPSRKARDWSNVYASAATYTLSSPSQDFVSILFRQDMTGAAAHSNWTYSAITFNRRTGRDISLNELFPGKASIAAELTPLIKKSLQGKGNDLSENDLDLDMKRIVLTSEGMRIVYAPYEIASYSEGEFLVDLPREELIKLGADKSIWK